MKCDETGRAVRRAIDFYNIGLKSFLTGAPRQRDEKKKFLKFKEFFLNYLLTKENFLGIITIEGQAKNKFLFPPQIF